MNRMNVAILGLGRIGGQNAETLKISEYVDKIYGYEPDERYRNERCAELKIIPATLDAILADPEIRLIYIATPNALHVPLAIRGLRAGKAVMCEKPMGNSLQEAAELIRALEETKGFLQVGFELRYSRLYQKTHDWITRGLIGDVVNIQCRYYCCEFHGKDSWRSQCTGSFLIGEKLSHYLDLERWWFGDSPVSVYSASAPKVVPYFQHRDNHQMILRFSGGRIGTLNFIMYIAETLEHDPLVDPIEKQSDDGHYLQYHICGARGAIENDVFRRRLRRWEFSDSPAGLKSEIVETITFPPEQDEAYFHNIRGQNLRIAELVAKGLPPENSATDAFETMKLCFAAEISENEERVVSLKELDSL